MNGSLQKSVFPFPLYIHITHGKENSNSTRNGGKLCSNLPSSATVLRIATHELWWSPRDPTRTLSCYGPARFGALPFSVWRPTSYTDTLFQCLTPIRLGPFRVFFSRKHHVAKRGVSSFGPWCVGRRLPHGNTTSGRAKKYVSSHVILCDAYPAQTRMRRGEAVELEGMYSIFTCSPLSH